MPICSSGEQTQRNDYGRTHAAVGPEIPSLLAGGTALPIRYVSLRHPLCEVSLTATTGVCIALLDLVQQLCVHLPRGT